MSSPLDSVVILNDYCYVNGGASRIAIDEATALAASGLRVTFFGATGPVGKELSAAPLETICLNQPELLEVRTKPSVALQGLWNVRAARELRTLLGRHDPARTVIHLHGYTKSLTSSPVRTARELGFDVVCTLHDFFSACPNGAFFDYVAGAPCPRRAMSLDCIGASCDKRHYAHKLYRVARTAVQSQRGLLPGGVGHFISISKGATERLKPYLPKVATFHDLENLVDVPQLPPIDVAGNRDLVAVGRLDVEKGIEVLLQAVAQTGSSLTLIGDGPLRALAESTPGCRVTGWLTPQGVQEELARARCLVFPSLWYETYGLVVAEAAARGVPAIVSDICAAAERVQDGVHGWHTRAGSATDLARCIALSQDDARVHAAGRAAYDRYWAAPPNRANHVAGLIGIYEAMLRARS